MAVRDLLNSSSGSSFNLTNSDAVFWRCTSGRSARDISFDAKKCGDVLACAAGARPGSASSLKLRCIGAPQNGWHVAAGAITGMEIAEHLATVRRSACGDLECLKEPKCG